jgi:hypothetical protein
MATLLANSIGNHASSSSKRSYVTTAAFNGIIYSYTATLNTSTMKNEGRLVALTTLPSGTTMTATNCPAGRILRESGRKLYPGANPGLAVGDTYAGSVVGTTATNHMWVAVFDHTTGLRGFIDPNAPQFSVYNTDRNPAFVDTAEDTGGAPTRLGQPVFTSGNITTTGGTVIQYRTISALADGTPTLTTAQTLGGWISMTPGANPRVVTLPSTASIITALGSTVGVTSDIVVYSANANAIRLTQGDTSTTFVGGGTSGSYTDVANTTIRFIIAVNSATTVVIYRC